MALFKKNQLKRAAFLECTYTDRPGSHSPSLDDLRSQAVAFERSIFDYLTTKKAPPPTKKRETLDDAIKDRLSAVPLYPQLASHWPRFMDEANELRKIRNKIVHSDFADLPEVADLYARFKRANEMLYPFKIYARKNKRFSCPEPSGEGVKVIIDGILYVLNPADVSNLLLELHPASRGKQNYIKGRAIEAKVTGYDVEKYTYFIGEAPPFELDQDEAATLEDMLISWVGRECYIS
ncbi:hypothetical protein [Pseudomonas sp.]|uniref:hypothetical protein n=1 Tax=Pseudomonas sp. TaxID=306 RepID=UPI003BB4C92B